MYTVFIIEENKQISDALVSLIHWEELGYQILGVASNGIVGRAIIEQHKPDIIFLSMSMMYLGGKGFIDAVENIDYPFRIIQLYSRRESLVDRGYSAKIGLSLNKNSLNSMDLIRALSTASANLMRNSEDDNNFVAGALYKKRNDAILRLLQGISAEEYSKLTMRFRFALNDKQLGIIIFYPFEDRLFDEKLRKQLTNIITAYLSYNNGGEVFITNNNRLGAIINFGETKENYTQHLFFLFIAEKLCNAIKNQIGIDVDCILADDASDIYHLNKVFNAAQELETYRYFKCATNVLTREYITKNAVYVSFNEIENCIQDIHNALCNLDYQQLNQEITRLYLSLVKSSIDLAIVNYVRDRLSSIYKSYLTEFCLDIDMKTLGIIGEQFVTIEQEYFRMKSVFSYVVEKATTKQENLHPIIRKSTNYINHYFAEEITLQSVADIVNVSPAYLSRLFSQELNTKFVDYLTQIRVEKAKKMISFSDLKIRDIAKKVGYHDEKYFCRVFKKVSGETPSEYRKGERLRDQNEEVKLDEGSMLNKSREISNKEY